MRLIDADALIDDINNGLWDWEQLENITGITVLKQTISDIQNAPVIDAVPVVRCKECNFAYRTGCVIELYDCRACVTGECHDPYFFCSYGERRNDD